MFRPKCKLHKYYIMYKHQMTHYNVLCRYGIQISVGIPYRYLYTPILLEKYL